MNGVEFELKPGGLSIVSGANVQEIFFDLGQNKAIDATVNEISEDTRYYVTKSVGDVENYVYKKEVDWLRARNTQIKKNKNKKPWAN